MLGVLGVGGQLSKGLTLKEIPSDVTQALHAWKAGDENALHSLLPKIYDELHRLAAIKIGGQPGVVEFQATALVNEFYLRFMNGLSPEDQPKWENRTHFFSVVAAVMRRILVDHWRQRSAEQRGGGRLSLTLDEALIAEISTREIDILALDQALTRLRKLDPQQVSIVEMRFFAGLTFEEIGRSLQVADRTVKRKWAAARIWLLRELNRQETSC